MNLRALISLVLLGTVCAPDVASSKTIMVPDEYDSIQGAIVGASDGDTILVSPGTYFERLDFQSKRLQIRSSDGAAVTTIDATFLGPAVRINGEHAESVFEGFTVTRGLGTTHAGGIDIVHGAPLVRANIIVNNRGGGGGNGISVRAGAARIVGNLVSDNHNHGMSSGGGGGGGIRIAGSSCVEGICGVHILRNVISGNSVDQYTWGGGILVQTGGPVRIAGNVIRNNSAPSQGGGIYMHPFVLTDVIGNLILENSAPVGSAIAWHNGSGARGPFLIGNTIRMNAQATESEVFGEGFNISTRIINNLMLARLDATVLECSPEINVEPPIVESNLAWAEGPTVYSGLCSGAENSAGNLAEMPLMEADSITPSAASPAIDHGNQAFNDADLDLLGGSRVHGVTIDIGALERTPRLMKSGFEQIDADLATLRSGLSI